MFNQKDNLKQGSSTYVFNEELQFQKYCERDAPVFVDTLNCFNKFIRDRHFLPRIDPEEIKD